MSAEALLVMRPRWSAVASAVSVKLGNTYTGNYVLQISSGTKANKRVAEALRELGMMADQLNHAAHSEVQPPREHPALRALVDRWGIDRDLLAQESRHASPRVFDAELFVTRRLARIWHDLIAQPEIRALQYPDNLFSCQWKIRPYGRASVDPTYREQLIREQDAWSAVFARLAPDGINSIEPMLIYADLDLRTMAAAWERSVDLSMVVGSGKNGRITRRDVEGFASTGGTRDGWRLQTSPRLLRQRRILAQHIHDLLRTNRSLCGVLAATQDRLAATSLRLGDETISRLAAEARLETERETSARLDGIVRRLAARPPIKRRTTHVEIAGLVFRDRTVTKGARS